MRPASSNGDRAQGHARRNGRLPKRRAAWLIQDGRPLKRYVTTVGALLFSVPLILSGIVILQNAIGGWPDDPPPQLQLQLVVRDTVPGADLDVEAVTQLESRVIAVAADSLRARARADSVSFYLLWPLAQRAVSWDFRLLLLTFFMGALGAWIHAASSFVRYVGNREFTSSWGPWYLIRPLVGGALALVFYTVIRVGLVTTGGSTVDALSHYSAAAFAGLVGLFSERASKKLADVFDALFTPRPEDKDADQLGERAGGRDRHGAPDRGARPTLGRAWSGGGARRDHRRALR
jgi:hypothetical protein